MTPDEVKQSITGWCSSDDDLEIASDRFEPGTDFAFGLKAGTLSSAPVDLVVVKSAGADRVTIRRSVTLSGDNVDAANRLIASRPGSVTAAAERSGLDTTVVAQTYVYLDGLSKHTFVQAVAELARTSTLLDAIGGVETASAVDAEAATVASDAVDADSEPDSDVGCGHSGDARALLHRFHLPATFDSAAELHARRDPGRSAAANTQLHAPTVAGTAGAADLHASAGPAIPGATRAGAAGALSPRLPADGVQVTRCLRRECALGAPRILRVPWSPTSRPACRFRWLKFAAHGRA